MCSSAAAWNPTLVAHFCPVADPIASAVPPCRHHVTHAQSRHRSIVTAASGDGRSCGIFICSVRSTWTQAVPVSDVPIAKLRSDSGQEQRARADRQNRFGSRDLIFKAALSHRFGSVCAQTATLMDWRRTFRHSGCHNLAEPVNSTEMIEQGRRGWCLHLVDVLSNTNSAQITRQRRVLSQPPAPSPS